MRHYKLLLVLALAASTAGTATAQSRPRTPANSPDIERFPPFRIIGNVYYVGSRGLAAYLITTPEGHILVDTGLPETGPLVLESIATLGFKPSDVRIMLSSHAHFDHVGGHALVKAKTGAKVYASLEDAKLLESGGAQDFRFGGEVNFDSVKVDQRLRDGEAVSLGGTVLTAHVVPGHTKGNTMWTFSVTEGGKKYNAMIAPSMSINPGVKLVNYAPYPMIARDYALSLEYLSRLTPDVFLGPHASFFHMEEKARLLKAGSKTNPFIDPEGYQTFIAGYQKAYLDQLAKEQSVVPGQ